MVVLSVVVLAGGSFAGDPGIGWHMRTGQTIANQLSIPREDPFLFSSQGSEWICNQWLADLIFWAVYSAGGWPLLHILAVGLGLATYVCILPGAWRGEPIPRLLAILALFLGILLGSIQWMIRPVIFSFFLFALAYREASNLCEGNESLATWRTVLRLCLLFLLWANIHPAFILGLYVLAAGLCDCLWSCRLVGRRDWRKIFILAAAVIGPCLATLVNPYGIGLHRAAWRLGQDRYFMQLNVEWLSPDFRDPLFWPFLAVLFLLIGFRMWAGKSSWRIFDLLLVPVFVCLSLLHRRYIPFFSIIAIVPLSRSFWNAICCGAPQSGQHGLVGKIKETIVRLDGLCAPRGCGGFSIGPYLPVVFMAVASFVLMFHRLPGSRPGDSSPDEFFPKSAIDYIEFSSREGGKIFNHPNWGGYITWRLWPKHKAFIDDRNELNGRERYEEFFKINRLEHGWRELLSAYEIDWLLIKPDSALARGVTPQEGWHERHRDAQAVLFERS